MSELLDVTVHDGRATLIRSDVCVRGGDLYDLPGMTKLIGACSIGVRCLNSDWCAVLCH